MTKSWTLLAAGAAMLLALGERAQAQTPGRDLALVESANDVVRQFTATPLHAIPTSLMRQARAVAIFPHMVKAGLILDHRAGKGVVMVRRPDGSWSDPIYVELEGTGLGIEAGFEKTDLILVFKTDASLERMLKGRLTLGTDVAVAAGLVGRDAERDHNGNVRAEIISYSHSRGLFAGVSIEGSHVTIDGRANESFYGLRGCRAEDVLGRRWTMVPAVEALKAELFRVSGPMVKDRR